MGNALTTRRRVRLEFSSKLKQMFWFLPKTKSIRFMNQEVIKFEEVQKYWKKMAIPNVDQLYESGSKLSSAKTPADYAKVKF